MKKSAGDLTAALSTPMSRRALLRRGAALGLSAPVLAAAMAACGGAGESNGGTEPGGGGNTPAGDGSGTQTGSGWTPRQLSAALTGSGSSFVDPAMQMWIQAYQGLAPNVTVNYQSVGSGQGKKDFIGGVTNFAGTDAPMTDEELDQLPGALHIPVVIGAVAVTYNLPGVENLQLSPEALAGIFLGQITKWDDPAIKADNPEAALPGDAITVMHRSDGSGTTAIFTDYLSKVSPEWQDAVGAGTAVQWPVGVGAEKNPGVAAGVLQTPGAIGYVELIYSLSNDMPVAALKNASGAFVLPSLESSSAAADGFLNDIPDDLRAFITNPQEGEGAYPIAGFSWVLLRGEYEDATIGQAITDFLYWIITAGQATSQQLHYAPVPESVQQLAIAKLEQVTAGGEQVFTAPGE